MLWLHAVQERCNRDSNIETMHRIREEPSNFAMFDLEDTATPNVWNEVPSDHYAILLKSTLGLLLLGQ
jgi:hypothetical protein